MDEWIDLEPDDEIAELVLVAFVPEDEQGDPPHRSDDRQEADQGQQT